MKRPSVWDLIGLIVATMAFARWANSWLAGVWFGIAVAMLAPISSTPPPPAPRRPKQWSVR